MTWFTHAFNLLSPLLPITYVDKTPNKTPVKAAVKKTLAAAKGWKSQAADRYKAARAIVGKHPYIASGLSLLAVSVLLKGVNAETTPFKPNEKASSHTAQAPETTSTPSASITSLPDSIKFPEVKPSVSSAFEMHFPSSVSHLIHDIIVSTDTPLTKAINEMNSHEEHSKEINEFTENDFLIGDPSNSLMRFFEALDETTPQHWHSRITTHEHLPTAMHIAVSIISSLILHFLRTRMQSGGIVENKVTTTVESEVIVTMGCESPLYKCAVFMLPDFTRFSEEFYHQYNSLCDLKTALDFSKLIKYFHSELFEYDLHASSLTKEERNEIISIASRQLCLLNDNLPLDIIPFSRCAHQ